MPELRCASGRGAHHGGDRRREERQPVHAGAHRLARVGPEARLDRVLGVRHEPDDIAAGVGQTRDVVAATRSG